MPVRNPPPFYEEIRRSARSRWEQLEADTELAGPWWQLFRQIQSPRHILSELLQNADDAGATSAHARIENGIFVFEHNGEDFKKDHFASLCKFGYSNKRALRTIGFRGIGFKSTFSLGDDVDVITPSLAIRFSKKRFTEPIWIPQAPIVRFTRIQVKILDSARQEDLQKNLDEWSESPVSLLFFNNIKKLTISGTTLERNSLGKGPVKNSEVVQLKGGESQKVMIIRSDEEAFPEDALEEIRQERITGDTEFKLPPCRVELVMGLSDPQKLYVILPTDVTTKLPFSCNAPFIQDPARSGIKNLSLSPTNRWLFKRLSQLAATTMVAWLKQSELSLAIRAQAYDLLPDKPSQKKAENITYEQIISVHFLKELGGEKALLTTAGNVVTKGACISPPLELYEIWQPDQLPIVFGERVIPTLAFEVSSHQRERLASWEWIKQITPSEVLNSLLKGKEIPRPKDYRSIWNLWLYIWDHLSRLLWGDSWKKLQIFPIEGSQTLKSSMECVKMGIVSPVLSNDDWKFLSEFLLVIDPKWITFLDECRKETSRIGNRVPYQEVARQILEKTGFTKATPLDTLFDRAYQQFIGNKTGNQKELIRFAQIAAALDVQVPDDFQYICRDLKPYPIGKGLSIDLASNLEPILPEEYANSHLITSDYFKNDTQFQKRWIEWVSSKKSGLRSIVGFIDVSKNIATRSKLREIVKQRGGIPPSDSDIPLKNDKFILHDHDFDPVLWDYWNKHKNTDPRVWVTIIRLLINDPAQSWKSRIRASIDQEGKQYDHPVKCGDIKTTWVIKFQALPCLLDDHEISRIPSQLFLRNKDTEPLQGIEAFVHHDLDIAETKRLLEALGTQTSPIGTKTILDRIRIFVGNQSPPTYELENLYGRLDRIISRLSTGDIAQLKQTFENERLIFTSQNTWVTSKEAFQYDDEQVSVNVPLIFPQVRQLSLWNRIGVAERPTLELLIASLQDLKSGVPLDAATLKRVRPLLGRAPLKIWNEYAHWLSLDGCWVPVSELSYGLSMQSLIKWGSLYPQIKRKTANLQMLNAETRNEVPFSQLKDLNSVIEYRLVGNESRSSKPIPKQWITTLGRGLQRVSLDDEPCQRETRAQALRLTKTQWHHVHEINKIPCIEGTPVGEPQRDDVFWDGDVLYVRSNEPGKIVSAIGDEIGRQFPKDFMPEVVKTCFERNDQFILDYLGSKFTLIESSEGSGLAETSEVVPSVQPSTNPPGFHAAQGTTPEEVIEPPEVVPIQPAVPSVHEPEPPDSVIEPPRSRALRSTTPLIDRFAVKFGYYWDDQKSRYINEDGTWLQKIQGSFNYEMHDADGDTLVRFWLSDQSLDSGSIEINADLWEQIKQDLDHTALVLTDENEQFIVLTGNEVKRRIDEEELMLFVTKYRLRRRFE